ncbi:unnamed protein product [Mesocestoides corti]|uniref:Uncharacterized protein n=1 Tax=Mesocestoides corti TaxID=53468 RepID=A0A0R3U2H3_MESCO|nr:unnamed protein product [Mesocestoides corti]
MIPNSEGDQVFVRPPELQVKQNRSLTTWELAGGLEMSQATVNKSQQAGDLGSGWCLDFPLNRWRGLPGSEARPPLPPQKTQCGVGGRRRRVSQTRFNLDVQGSATATCDSLSFIRPSHRPPAQNMRNPLWLFLRWVLPVEHGMVRWRLPLMRKGRRTLGCVHLLLYRLPVLLMRVPVN